MKKLLATALIMGVLTGTLTAEEQTQLVESVQQKTQFTAKLEKEMATAQKQVQSYCKNAEKATAKGNTELAAAFQACSDAKKKTADSIEKYLTAENKACEIAKADKQLAPLMSTTLCYDKKGERLTTRIKNLEACKAKNHDNSEFCAELDNMTSSLQCYNDSKKEFKEANAKLRGLKKKA